MADTNPCDKGEFLTFSSVFHSCHPNIEKANLGKLCIQTRCTWKSTQWYSSTFRNTISISSTNPFPITWTSQNSFLHSLKTPRNPISSSQCTFLTSLAIDHVLLYCTWMSDQPIHEHTCSFHFHWHDESHVYQVFGARVNICVAKRDWLFALSLKCNQKKLEILQSEINHKSLCRNIIFSHHLPC